MRLPGFDLGQKAGNRFAAFATATHSVPGRLRPVHLSERNDPGLRKIPVLTFEVANMIRTDLEKNKGLKINGSVNRFGTPGRFGKDAGSVLERREQRKLDQALGLVPFAVKIDAGLANQIRALAQARQTGLSEVAAELLQRGLENQAITKR